MNGLQGPENALQTLAGAAEPGLVREMIGFLRANRAWWLVPILALLAGFGVIAGLAATGAAPYIYALF